MSLVSTAAWLFNTVVSFLWLGRDGGRGRGRVFRKGYGAMVTGIGCVLNFQQGFFENLRSRINMLYVSIGLHEYRAKDGD